MRTRTLRWLGLLLLATGCMGPTRPAIDGVVCDLAALPRDSRTLGMPITTPAELPPPKKGELINQLDIPSEVPGAEIQKMELPPADREGGTLRKQALREYFPKLPAVESETVPVPGPDGKPITLCALQSMALSNNPTIRQAVARVEAARGAAVQAGLLDNPTVGVAGNTVGTANTAGQIGPYFDQQIPLGNKLQLSRAVASMSLRLAEIDLRRAELDLLTQVRRGFFKVLVAQESIRILRGLEQLANDIHTIQVEQVVAGGEAAPYEPLQTRANVTLARAALVRARHELLSAWKQLTASVGLPGLPYTQLAGNLGSMPLPVYDYPTVLAHVLKSHTDLLRAESGILKARHSVALAKMANVPNLAVNVQITPDFSTPGNPITPTFTVGLNGLPVWHRNQGLIAQAEAELIAADEEMPRIRNELTGKVAEAFQRFAATRTQVVYFRDGVLPDQVRAYRAIRDRYVRDPSVPDSSQPNFQDVINAQQNLAQLLLTYLEHLNGFTSSLVDVADLAQTDDLYALASARVCVGPLGLELAVECRPCSPVDSGVLRVPAADWPVHTPGLRQPSAIPQLAPGVKPQEAKEPELPAPKSVPPARQPEAVPPTGAGTPLPEIRDDG